MAKCQAIIDLVVAEFAEYPYQAAVRLSPAVLPTPVDWDKHSVATGYWFLDQSRGWKPLAELWAFLEAGPPPVYVGFGSMPTSDMAQMTHLVLAIRERAGQRGVLAAGWALWPQPTCPKCLLAHDWQFPQMAAVIHHGEAGITAVGLRAGRPTVICSFFGDQPFWDRRVAALRWG